MGEKYQAFLERTSTINHLSAAAGLLGWDQQVMMPPGGTPARAAQMAALSTIIHEMTISEETQRLLEDAAAEMQGVDYASDEASNIRVMQENLRLLLKLPTAFVAEMVHHTSLAHDVWAKARATNDFAAFAPTLTRQMDMARQAAEYLGYDENPYDALLGQYEYGLKSAQVRAIFEGHKPQLVELIAAIREVTDRVDDSVLHQHYPVEQQREFGLRIIKAFGFDFERGRQDVSVHPFASGSSPLDVRITTRFEANFLNPALFGLMHESGHGMYDQGIPVHLMGQPIGNAISLSIHESQSRLWENVVGRSRGFWQWAFPQLQAIFPGQVGGVDMDTFYKAVNKSQPSFIRVEADEATYNLHIMLRFELEDDLMNDRVKVNDLPRIWNERFEASFGLVPPTDSLGVLQDVHWSAGLVGYFPTYALGNLLSVQFYNEALKAHPGIPTEITEGKFDTLLGWLRENIHHHGCKFTMPELVERVTGQQIDSRPYIAYLKAKYGEIYGL
ncbi:MAG: carboxypeptidase M32 [Anaerolineae bacterium]